MRDRYDIEENEDIPERIFHTRWSRNYSRGSLVRLPGNIRSEPTHDYPFLPANVRKNIVPIPRPVTIG